MRKLLGIGFLLTVIAAPLKAQGVFQRVQVLSGSESRGYFFRPGVGIRTVGQWTVPLVALVPINRDLTLDVGTRWAHSRITTYSGSEGEITGLTDTEVRLAYTLGADLAVVTLVAGLPTGKSAVSSGQLTVLGTVASDFLPLPVSTYGTGATLTGGFAVARSLGPLNVGLGGSARWAQEYEPFSDLPITYSPGIESRFQIAADALLGSGRLSFGGTFSTFSSDDFAGLGGVGLSQSLKPGSRVMAEASYVAPLGNGNLSVYLWDFARSGGTIETLQTQTPGENVFNFGTRWTLPSSRIVLVVPGVEFRKWWRDGNAAGDLVAAELSVDVRPTDRFQVETRGRTEIGSLVNPTGDDVSLQGWSLSLLVRVSP